MKPADYNITHNFILLFYCKRLKRMGSVLSRSELDPFFIHVNGIIQFGPKTGLTLVDI